MSDEENESGGGMCVLDIRVSFIAFFENKSDVDADHEVDNSAKLDGSNMFSWIGASFPYA